MAAAGGGLLFHRYWYGDRLDGAAVCDRGNRPKGTHLRHHDWRVQLWFCTHPVKRIAVWRKCRGGVVRVQRGYTTGDVVAGRDAVAWRPWYGMEEGTQRPVFVRRIRIDRERHGAECAHTRSGRYID